MVLFEKKASLHSRTVNSHILPFHSKKYSNPIHLEAVAQRCYVKKLFLEISQNSQENTCARVSFLIKSKVFLCEFCKISKNKFFYRILPAAAFEGVINIKCRDIHGIIALLIVIRFWLHIKEKQILNVIVMVQLCKFRNL